MKRILCVGVVAVLAFVPSVAQEKNVEDPLPKLEDLDKLQADAIKNHPAVKVTEAKVRLAEAELAQTQAIVKAKVRAAYANINAAQAAEAEALSRHQRATELFLRKAINSEELGAAKLTYIKYRYE